MGTLCEISAHVKSAYPTATPTRCPPMPLPTGVPADPPPPQGIQACNRSAQSTQSPVVVHPSGQSVTIPKYAGLTSATATSPRRYLNIQNCGNQRHMLSVCGKRTRQPKRFASVCVCPEVATGRSDFGLRHSKRESSRHPGIVVRGPRTTSTIVLRVVSEIKR